MSPTDQAYVELRLVGVFPSGDNAGHWPQQRASNTILSLAVTRILISKGGAGTINNQVVPPLTRLIERKH